MVMMGATNSPALAAAVQSEATRRLNWFVFHIIGVGVGIAFTFSGMMLSFQLGMSLNTAFLVVIDSFARHAVRRVLSVGSMPSPTALTTGLCSLLMMHPGQTKRLKGDEAMRKPRDR
jgi:hypothetical protein